MPAEGINPIEFPDVFCHVWGMFLSLSKKRKQDPMSGMMPIEYQEMVAYFSLMKYEATPLEIEIIDALDLTWINSQA
nr:hypothetical protein [uncultured Undibacterium sp.]